MLRSVFRSFTVSRALVILFAALGYFLLPSVHEGISVPLSRWGSLVPFHLVPMGRQLVHVHRRRMVTSGSAGDQSNVAFFPLYPLTVKAAAGCWAGDYLLAGCCLSSAFLFGGLVFLYRLVRDDYR